MKTADVLRIYIHTVDTKPLNTVAELGKRKGPRFVPSQITRITQLIKLEALSCRLVSKRIWFSPYVG